MQVLEHPYCDVCTALIVEPTKLYQGIHAHILEECHFAVTSVSSAAEAYEKVKEHSYTVIVMSMRLADEDGVHLCMKLRASEATARTPIIMIIASENKETAKKALVAGATEVLYKDEIEELKRYINRTFQNEKLGTDVGGNILYVEDQRSVAALTQKLLEQNGYSVTHTTTAEAALEILEQQEFDLVLTDLILEGKKTGFSLVRDIKAMSGRVTEVPILAVTGMDDSRRKIDLLYQGVSDYIKKPVINDELLARVSNLVKMQHLRDQVEKQKKEIMKLAMQDQLTKLYNRHYLMDAGPMKISEGFRHKIDISLLVIDLDHFKSINDAHGHSAGDDVLCAVGKKLQELTHTEDICARFGGEEFVLILSHCNADFAAQKAEDIRRQIEALRIGELKVTSSIGLATMSHEKKLSFQELFDAADKAVYRAKDNGRNRVEVEPV